MLNSKRCDAVLLSVDGTQVNALRIFNNEVFGSFNHKLPFRSKRNRGEKINNVNVTAAQSFSVNRNRATVFSSLLISSKLSYSPVRNRATLVALKTINKLNASVSKNYSVVFDDIATATAPNDLSFITTHRMVSSVGNIINGPCMSFSNIRNLGLVSGLRAVNKVQVLLQKNRSAIRALRHSPHIPFINTKNKGILITPRIKIPLSLQTGRSLSFTSSLKTKNTMSFDVERHVVDSLTIKAKVKVSYRHSSTKTTSFSFGDQTGAVLLNMSVGRNKQIAVNDIDQKYKVRFTTGHNLAFSSPVISSPYIFEFTADMNKANHFAPFKYISKLRVEETRNKASSIKMVSPVRLSFASHRNLHTEVSFIPTFPDIVVESKVHSITFDAPALEFPEFIEPNSEAF